MNRIEVLYQVTKELESVVNQEITPENRGQVIEKINQLVEQRGQYIQNVTPPYTAAEKETGKDLIHLNERIQVKLDQLFEGLKKEMKQIQKQKKSTQSYTNPYKNVETSDGMFMDQKK